MVPRPVASKPTWASLLKGSKEQLPDAAEASAAGGPATADLSDKGRQGPLGQTQKSGSDNGDWVQVARGKQASASPPGQLPKLNNPAGGASSQLLAQAHMSPLDQATGKVRCRACGQAFPTYTSLAQHLSSKHAGINSEDVKFLQLRGLVGPAGASGGETGAKPSKRSRAQGGVTLADLFAGPSLQEAAAASRAGASPSAGSLKHRGDRDKAGAKPSSTTLSFGSLLGRAAAAKPTRPAISKGKGAKAGLSLQQHKQHGALPRRGKLRWENAKKKQRVSHVKRLVLQERAARGLFAAEQILSKACSTRAEIVAHQARLTAEMQASSQEAGIPVPPVVGPSADQLVAQAQPGAQAPLAPKLPSLLPPQMPASVRAATLQLALQQVAKRLGAAQRMVETATQDLVAAQQQHAKALRLPIATEDSNPEHPHAVDNTPQSHMPSGTHGQQEQPAGGPPTPRYVGNTGCAGALPGAQKEADAKSLQQQGAHVQQQEQQQEQERQQQEQERQQQEREQHLELQGGGSDNDSSEDEDSSDSSDDDGSEPGPFKDLLSQWATNSKVPVGFGKLLKRSSKPTSQPANPFASFKAASKDGHPAPSQHGVSSSGSSAVHSAASPPPAATAPPLKNPSPPSNAPLPPSASQQDSQHGTHSAATKPLAPPPSTTNPSSSDTVLASIAVPFASYDSGAWSAPPTMTMASSQPSQAHLASADCLLNFNPSPHSTAAVFHSSTCASSVTAPRSSTGEPGPRSSGFADLHSDLQSHGSSHSHGSVEYASKPASFSQKPSHSHGSVEPAPKPASFSGAGGTSCKGLQARLATLDESASVPRVPNVGEPSLRSPRAVPVGEAGGGSLTHGPHARTSRGSSAVYREGRRREVDAEEAPAAPHSQEAAMQQQQQPAGLASLTAQLHSLQLQQQHQSAHACQGPATQLTSDKGFQDKQAQMQYISHLQRQLQLAQQQQQEAPASEERLNPRESTGSGISTPSVSPPLSGATPGPTSTPAVVAYFPSQSHQQGPPPAQRPNSLQNVPPPGSSAHPRQQGQQQPQQLQHPAPFHSTPSAQWTGSGPHSQERIAKAGPRTQSAPMVEGEQTREALSGALSAAELEGLLQQQQQQQRHHPQQQHLGAGADRPSTGIDRRLSVPIVTSYPLSSPALGASHSGHLMQLQQQDLQPHMIGTVPAGPMLQHHHSQHNSHACSSHPSSSTQAIFMHRRDSAGGGGAASDVPPKPQTFRSVQRQSASSAIDFQALNPAELLHQQQQQQPQYLPLQQSVPSFGRSKVGGLKAGPGSLPNLGASPSPQVSPPASAPNLGVGSSAPAAAAHANPAAASRRPTSRADMAAYLALGQMQMQLPVYRSSRGKGSEGAQQAQRQQTPAPPPQPPPHLPASHALVRSMAAPLPPPQQQPMPLISMPLPAMSMGVGGSGGAGGAGSCAFMAAPDQAYLVADQGGGLGPVYAYHPYGMLPPGQPHVGVEPMHPAALPAGYPLAAGYPHPAGVLVQPHVQPVQLQPPQGQIDLHSWQQMQLHQQLRMPVQGYELGGMCKPDSGGGMSIGPGSDELGCTLCGVKCNSRTTLDQHLSSRKHLAKVAKQALAVLDAAERALPSSSSSRALPLTYVGPGANTHGLCRQIITPDLNQVVSELLLRIKGFQDRAMARDPIKAAAHRWFVCGLREVRKVLRLRKARLVIAAPNIEGVSADGGLDEFLGDILAMCEEQNVPSVFALTRKKMGEIYGARKRVSAVALLELNGVDDLVGQVLDLAEEGRVLWNAAIEEEQEQQQQQQQQQQQEEPHQQQQPPQHFVAQPGLPPYAQQEHYAAPSVPHYAQPGVGQYAPAEREVYAGHMEMPPYEPQ